MLPLLDSGSDGGWQPGDQEAIRQALALPATVPCLDAISRAMADLERHRPEGVLSTRALLDAISLIDRQLLAGGPEQKQAIEKHSHSGPIAGWVAAAGDAPLQKADVIAYDTALLRQESEIVYSNPRSSSAALLSQRRRYAEQLLLVLPALASWVQISGSAAGTLGSTALLQPFANARLLLHQNAIPDDTSSAVVASHVLECFLERANYISAKENGPGVDTGDFTYNGYLCPSARLPPKPGAIWLSSDLVWQQHGWRVATDGTTVVAPCTGWIWLGGPALPAGRRRRRWRSAARSGS